MANTFKVLQEIDVNELVQKKGAFTYLSWAHAWQILKSHFPNSSYKIYENENGWCYFTDGATAWVKVGVTVEGEELIEYYPVTDYKNNSFPLDAITSRIVNDSIQRALVKCIARHGLGLYIYAGEDIPMSDLAEKEKEAKEAATKLQAEISKLESALAKCDLSKVAALYKHNSLSEFNAKEVANALAHIPQIEERCAKAEADFKPEKAEKAESKSKKAGQKLPTNLTEAIAVPCSLTRKGLADKSMGEIFGEGNLKDLEWIATQYKGKDEAMRKAAQIILAENSAA